MADYIALLSFEDDQLGNVKRGSTIELNSQAAKKYEKAKLIKLVGAGSDKPNPIKAAGIQSSASPAAPALPQKTAKKQKSGSKKKRGAPSS